MVDYCNKNRKDHILTIEDPIEFVHESKNCLVNHREVGVHTKSFSAALRGALREDPDIVLAGKWGVWKRLDWAWPAPAPATPSSAPCTPKAPPKPGTASSVAFRRTSR